MKRVIGVGGVFFKAKDPKALGEWYRRHLGMDVEQWGGVAFRWVTPENPGGVGTTVWSPFKEDTSYFAPSMMIPHAVPNGYPSLLQQENKRRIDQLLNRRVRQNEACTRQELCVAAHGELHKRCIS